MAHTYDEPDWLHGHAHEPNPTPPSPDPDLTLYLPNGEAATISPADLERLPLTVVADCRIVSTGHGTSGPFVFGGVRLRDLLAAYVRDNQVWVQVDVIGADGFGTRVHADELRREEERTPLLLALTRDGLPMTRSQGLVRLIAPTEVGDALRQIKWVARIVVHPSAAS